MDKNKHGHNDYNTRSRIVNSGPATSLWNANSNRQRADATSLECALSTNEWQVEDIEYVAGARLTQINTE